MRKLRILLTTAGLTLLIWIAADQSLTESAEVVVILDPVAEEGSPLLVELANPAAPQVKVTVVGQRQLVDDLARTGPHRARFTVDLVHVGHHTLDVRQELQRVEPLFAGLTIQTTDPPKTKILVDRTIHKIVPVEVARGSLEFEESFRVEPTMVRVAVREGHWKELEGKGPKFLIQLDRLFRGRPEGEQIEENVALETTLLGVPVEPDPPRVAVSGKLLRPLTTVSLAAVPVYFSASPEIWNHYEVELPQDVVLTQTITLRGPREVLDRVQTGEQRLTGTIIVTSLDAESAETFRSVLPTFRLPPDVVLLEEPAAVEFRLRPRGQEAELAMPPAS